MTATFPLREFSIRRRESVTKTPNATSVHEAGELEEMIWSISEQPELATTSDGGANHNNHKCMYDMIQVLYSQEVQYNFGQCAVICI